MMRGEDMIKEQILEYFKDINLMYNESTRYDDLSRMIDELEPKTGYWIEHFDESGKWYECNQCHTDWGGPVNYCPNCGVKM